MVDGVTGANSCEATEEPTYTPPPPTQTPVDNAPESAYAENFDASLPRAESPPMSTSASDLAERMGIFGKAALQTAQAALEASAGLGVEQQPVLGPGQPWDASAMLQKLGQDTGTHAFGPEVCGAMGFLGSVMQQGKQATLDMTDRLMDEIDDPQLKAEVGGIRKRIADGTATAADYKNLARAIYVTFNTEDDRGADPKALDGLNPQEVENMQKALLSPGQRTSLGEGGADPKITTVEASQKDMEEAFGNGDSVQLAVCSPGSETPDHAVTWGRDAKGRLYVYDPNREPDSVVFKPSPEYDSYFKPATGAIDLDPEAPPGGQAPVSAEDGKPLLMIFGNAITKPSN